MRRLIATVAIALALCGAALSATPAWAETDVPARVRVQMEAVLFPVCMERQDEDPASQTWCRCFARTTASAITQEQLELAAKEGTAKMLSTVQPSQFADGLRICGKPPRRPTLVSKKNPEEYKAETYRLIYPQCIARIQYHGGDVRKAHPYCHCRATIVADEMKLEHANGGEAVNAELDRRIDPRVKKECPTIK
ncbi:hypothetical protein JQ596_38185 [Bradyrhizobium manausense]|uniref:hypothetical protein n=1 Tax=Bradyrhizobium manausense TaxID=989370 RepID=UPI001BA9B863|nr:hypothetical protein [Bradyrhizobium manausense]MBR0831351.1 hypothetical protein [Bradyrhizobium manausense]